MKKRDQIRQEMLEKIIKQRPYRSGICWPFLTCCITLTETHTRVPKRVAKKITINGKMDKAKSSLQVR
jgi:hypothetical protein